MAPSDPWKSTFAHKRKSKYIRRHPDPHTANPHRVVDPPWCPPAPLQNMPGTTAFARHSLVSIALRIVLPLCFFEEHCIVNCEARPPHSKVQPPQNPSTATFRNRENQNGPLGTAMILMGPTGVNIGQFLSISVNSGRSMFLNEFQQTSVNFCQFRQFWQIHVFA